MNNPKVPLTFSLSLDHYHYLNEIAEKRGLSRSKVLQEAIEFYLKLLKANKVLTLKGWRLEPNSISMKSTTKIAKNND